MVAEQPKQWKRAHIQRKTWKTKKNQNHQVINSEDLISEETTASNELENNLYMLKSQKIEDSAQIEML